MVSQYQRKVAEEFFARERQRIALENQRRQELEAARREKQAQIRSRKPQKKANFNRVIGTIKEDALPWNEVR